jgi:serine/threonine-protein kinase
MADEGDSKLTGTQATVGTPLYMSPEQVRSSRNVDSRSDIWALGVILYELLAGRTPFEGSTTAAAAAIVADPTPPLKDFRPEVPLDLQTAIHHALSKDPKNRFGTVAEFAEAITPFASVIRPSMKPATSSPMLDSASRPTPAPSTPGHLRAPETMGTLAAPFALDHPSGTSLAPATTGGGPRSSTRWGVVAVVSVCAILAIGIGLAVASGTAAKSGAASNAGDPGAPMAPHSTPAAAITTVQVAAAPASSATPSASASEAPTAHSAPVRPAATRTPAAPAPPTPRPAPRPAATPSATSPSTHGGANPLFL